MDFLFYRLHPLMQPFFFFLHPAHFAYSDKSFGLKPPFTSHSRKDCHFPFIGKAMRLFQLSIVSYVFRVLLYIFFCHYTPVSSCACATLTIILLYASSFFFLTLCLIAVVIILLFPFFLFQTAKILSLYRIQPRNLSI
jgi:uncharacterized metal-binding protein